MLKKIALNADVSLDAFQFTARSLASNVASRRNMWLRNWEVDQGAQAKHVAVPFKGANLFGQALDPLLTKNKDKCKVLATPKGEQRKIRKSNFWGHKANYNQKGGFSQNQQANRSQFFLKNHHFTSQGQGGYNRGRASQSFPSSGHKPKGPRPS